jgi:hypothetical protein
MGKFDGIEPICYSRNVDLEGVLVFQPATFIMYIVALGMTSIMIYNIKSKYTAVGRKEIAMFFQLYLVTMLLETLLVTSIIPTASILYPFFTAAHIGLMSACFWCLVLNGFVGFQFAEDGTAISLWLIRISTFVVFLLVGGISMATFRNWGPFEYAAPSVLWAFYYIVNGILFLIYAISQIVLVVCTLDDRWPLVTIGSGITCFACQLVFMYIFSIAICEGTKHHVDGLFFGTIASLLSVMSVYKYWDSITKEDLEFSIDQKYYSTDEIEALLKEE